MNPCKKYKCSSDFNASPPQRKEKRETVRSIGIIKLAIPKSDWKAVPKRTTQPSLDMMIMKIVTLTMPLLRERAEKWLTFSQWRFLSPDKRSFL
jgi:hypothetical protein